MDLPQPVRTVGKAFRRWTRFKYLETVLATFCFVSPALMVAFDRCRYAFEEALCATQDPEKFEMGFRSAISHYWDMPTALFFYVPLTVAVMIFVVRATLREKYEYNWLLGFSLLGIVALNHEQFHLAHTISFVVFIVVAGLVLLAAFASGFLKLGVLVGGAVFFLYVGNLVDRDWSNDLLFWAEWSTLFVLALHFVLIAWQPDRVYQDAPLNPPRRKAANERRPETLARKPIGTQVGTGRKCPVSGVWEAQVKPPTTAPIAKGNRMPPYGGEAVTWELIEYA